MFIISGLCYKLATRICEQDLARIIGLMEGHRAAGIPAGHAYYADLSNQADLAIVKLQAEAVLYKQTVPTRTSIAVKVPTLKTLENMRDGISGKVSPIAITGMVLVGGLVLTTILAVYTDWYMLLTHIVSSHLGR